MYSQLEIRDSAHDIARNARKIINKASHEAFNAAQILRKRFRKTYPLVVDNVHTGTARALRKSKYYNDYARHGISALRANLGRDLRFVESALVHIGLGYLVLKIYNACNSGSAPVSTKIKNHIYEKPAESALIALGVGYLLGKIFR